MIQHEQEKYPLDLVKLFLYRRTSLYVWQLFSRTLNEPSKECQRKKKNRSQWHVAGMMWLSPDVPCRAITTQYPLVMTALKTAAERIYRRIISLSWFDDLLYETLSLWMWPWDHVNPKPRNCRRFTTFEWNWINLAIAVMRAVVYENNDSQTFHIWMWILLLWQKHNNE